MSFKTSEVRDKLYTAVLSDILDGLGYRSQTMDIAIRPLCPDSIIFGKARTMLSVPDSQAKEEPFMNQIEAVDLLAPGDVVVAATSGVETSAFWGELFSSAAFARQAAGAIIDGYIRDVRKVKELGFPLFSRGMHPGNSKGRQTVLHYDQPIQCGGVRVRTGDYLFAEIDGCIVIPHEIADDVFGKALEVASLENLMKKALFEGMSLKDAYLKYRVL